MLEIKRLANMLKKAGIPFRYYDGDFRPQYNYFKNKIIYPDCARKDAVCSVVQGIYTYGGLENKLEIMGLLTEEEKEYDNVCGWLTAEDVFERIKAHWEKVK